MRNNAEFLIEAKKALKEGKIFENAPMKDYTTFHIGGPADFLIFPASMEEVRDILKLFSKYEISYTILGNGSNVLVRDKGVRGAILKFDEPFSKTELTDDTLIKAGAGASLKNVSEFAADNGLTGLEFAIGIPGSIGGAIYMNAGAYGGEMKNIVVKVRSVSPNGEFFEFTQSELDLSYRRSIFQFNNHAIAEVTLRLSKGDGNTIRIKMEDLTRRREEKQPLEMPSAGSTFKRPTGYFAGTLIDQTGLKGLKVGGAQVSTKHAGFVVNTGNATAEDVLRLIEEVKRRVFETHGVKLFPEVRIIGEE